MSKKKKSSGAGKGDRNRVSDKKRYDENYEKIFGSTEEDGDVVDTEIHDHPLGVGFAHKDNKERN